MHHGLPAFGIGDCRYAAFRLVESEIDAALGSVEQTPVYFDVVAHEVGLGAELGDRGAVHRDSPLKDQFLGLAATGDAGLREDLLEALGSGSTRKVSGARGRGASPRPLFRHLPAAGRAGYRRLPRPVAGRPPPESLPPVPCAPAPRTPLTSAARSDPLNRTEPKTPLWFCRGWAGPPPSYGPLRRSTSGRARS